MSQIITFSLIYYVLITFTIKLIKCDSFPIVTTASGAIKGFPIHTDVSGKIKTINAFQGIPYAESPIGELRFKEPRPVKNWTGILNTISMRSACMQPKYESISEDCLYLNVWTPSQSFPTNDKYTVMFWIHGGAYISGSIFGENNGTMISSVGDVVIVSVNYRLGAFGFLYDGTDDAPGNMGLHDMVMALKWVNKNIANFGGDPNMVTIFGESAGAMAVGSLILITSHGKLFNRAILQSGSPNSYVGSDDKSEGLTKSKDLAKELKCLNADESINITCLRLTNGKLIVNYIEKSEFNFELFEPIYGDKLMPIKPSLALSTGKFQRNIDIIFGVVSDEGSGFITNLFVDLHPGSAPISVAKGHTYIQLIYTILKFPFSKSVADFYTKDLKDSDGDKIKMAVASSVGDFQITCPTILFGSAYAKWNKESHAYSYVLTYQRKHNDWTGVTHGTDVHLVFGSDLYNPKNYPHDEIQLTYDMINVWTTFAKTGLMPKLGNTTWTEAIDRNLTNPSVKYINLNPKNYTMVSDGYKSTCEGFWKTILN